MDKTTLLSITYLLLMMVFLNNTTSQANAQVPHPKQSQPRVPPPPMIIPGAYLDTSINSLPDQDPAVGRAAPAWLRTQATGAPMYVVDGKSATEAQLRRLKSTDVASVRTLDGARAAALYGKNVRRGLVIVTTKAGVTPVNEPSRP